jgi:hypothetical protein
VMQHSEKLWPPETPYARAAIGFVVVFWVVWMAMAAGQPLLRNWSKARPLIIIDDSGLWLRRYGALMRWSEIQSVEWEWLGQDARFTIVWTHEPFRLGVRMGYMDGDGNLWRPHSIYEMVKAHWKRNRAASVSAGQQVSVPGAVNPRERDKWSPAENEDFKKALANQKRGRVLRQRGESEAPGLGAAD